MSTGQRLVVLKNCQPVWYPAQARRIQSQTQWGVSRFQGAFEAHRADFLFARTHCARGQALFAQNGFNEALSLGRRFPALSEPVHDIASQTGASLELPNRDSGSCDAASEVNGSGRRLVDGCSLGLGLGHSS